MILSRLVTETPEVEDPSSLLVGEEGPWLPTAAGALPLLPSSKSSCMLREQFTNQKES